MATQGTARAFRYVVERGLPMPPHSRRRAGNGGRHAIYPWADMAPGDSFLVPCAPEIRPIMQGKMSGQGNAWGERFGRRFATRIVADGVRVWRTD